ncbi:MAG: uracil-DNA glycosylase [Chloroflexota bacterium]
MTTFFVCMSPIQSFVERLSLVPDMPAVFNPYQEEHPGGAIRQSNLARYLSRMATRHPVTILVGEAPGYRGCRVTGVPFTSEKILLSDSSPFGLFGLAAGFVPSDEINSPQAEATASTVWKVFLTLGECPLLWNAFPFHPHRPDDPFSNRTPRAKETDLGQQALIELLDLFPIQQVIAVGNVAHQAFLRWGIAAEKIRHPGHGGQAAFAQQLARSLRVGR